MKASSTKMGSLGLRFDDPVMEATWRAHRDAEATRPVRIGLLVFAVVMLLGGLGDWWQAYQAWESVALIRITVWSPLAVVGAWLVGQPWVRGHVLHVTAGLTILLTLSLLGLMIGVLPRSTAVDFPMYWTVLLLLVHVVTPLGFRSATFSGAVIVASFLATMVWHQVEARHLAAHTTFVLFAWALLITASWLLERGSRETYLAERRLTEARDDAERVLRAIVPQRIAQRLLAGESAIVDEVPDATVLFSDLVGFTELSKDLKANEVVAFLDGLFRRFEQATQEHGVDKIKTIGDAYMAADVSTDGHGASRIASLALSMQDLAREYAQLTGKAIQLRVGVHRGPLVAGVLGQSRFSYDLWGDTVNLASRMESHGEAGAIQLTDAAAKAISDTFLLRLRGPISIKGVGTVQTWWLEGRV